MYDESFQYTCGKTDPQFAIRYCDATSTFSHRTTATVPHGAVPIKTSPGDPDVDQHPEIPPLLPSLPMPNSAGGYWSSSYAVGGMKDVEVRRADELTAAERRQSFTGRRPVESPLYEPSSLTSSFIKVEESPSHDSAAAAPASVPVTSSLSSSPFCVDDRPRRDLLVDRNAGASKPRRRRRPNPSVPVAPRSPASAVRPSTPVSATPSSVSTSPDVGRLSSTLPFSLPPVPPGYRLVITHRPTPDTSEDASQVTDVKTSLRFLFTARFLNIFK